jgi:hypothetical protein
MVYFGVNMILFAVIVQVNIVVNNAKHMLQEMAKVDVVSIIQIYFMGKVSN